MKTLIVSFLAALALSAAPPAKTAPIVWMFPPDNDNGAHFRELFDFPDQWRETRSLIDVLYYADHRLDRQFTDDEIRSFFTKIREWNLKFGLEVGAVKEWGQTGEKAFSIQRPKWERFLRLGGRIDVIAIDEPLVCARKNIKKSDQYVMEETAQFIALVRRNYPDMRIGEIETYPSTSLADHKWWIQGLNKRLAELGVRGLDFYRLDVHWLVYNVRGEGSWREVKALEDYCRGIGLPFALIYWASAYPALQKLGLAGDDTWYVNIMQQGYDYALVGGAPDEYIIESWIGAPSRSVPETGDFTFTRSVRDFVRKFVRREGGPQ